MMLGLGETAAETLAVMRDLRAHGVDILTLGQYLRPSPKHLEIVRYVPPEEFDGIPRGRPGNGVRATCRRVRWCAVRITPPTRCVNTVGRAVGRWRGPPYLDCR